MLFSWTSAVCLLESRETRELNNFNEKYEYGFNVQEVARIFIDLWGVQLASARTSHLAIAN